jgi:hypothetical protein
VERYKLREANSADVRIYEHFKQKFQERVSAFGTARMTQRVAQLKAFNEKLTKQCIKSIIPPASTDPFSEDYPVFTYQINEGAPDVCQLAVMEELKFTDMLKYKQLQRFRGFQDFDEMIGA